VNPTLRIRLLGDFLLLVDDTPVTTVIIPRLQSLFAYLLLHRDAPQDRSHIAFLLWPDSTEAQAHTNLRKLLYQLRQALPATEHFLHVDNRSLQWRAAQDASWTLDVLEFEQALARAEQAEHVQETTTQRKALERALHLYRGDLLPNCYDEWILPERDRLRQLFVHAAERLIALLEQERDYAGAIGVAQRLLRYDPLQEAIYRNLMRLHALHGDRAAALRVYHNCATTLERELGIEPSKATRQAYEALMHVDTSAPVQTAQRGSGAQLIGRMQEWALLQAAWHRALEGHPHVVILSGEAGIGKTRLAEEMEAWVSRQGLKTAQARCYAAEGRAAYAPVIAWLGSGSIQANLATLDNTRLAELARLAPGLLSKRPGLAPPAPTTERWQRQSLKEALAHAVLDSGQPLLLLLDDLQWCDNETLEWLHYLLRFAPEAHLLLVGTVRSEEALPEHPLVALLGTLQRDGLVTEIPLGPLSTAETTTLAEQVAGQRFEAAMADTLYHETEGNPLFVVEMVRAGTMDLSQKTHAAQSANSSLPLLTQPGSKLPPTVQTVIAARFAQLSAIAREVANVAAVIGREFTFDVLARACGESEDAVVGGLDELWQRRIVREQGDSYDFSHDKLREYAYTALSSAHRRLLHRRVAQAFEAVYAVNQPGLDVVSGQIAAHYERAGLPGQAIPYYRGAGETAMRVYANAEAIGALQHAIALLEAGAPGYTRQGRGWEEVAAIYADLGDVFLLLGRLSDARQSYQQALAWMPPQESLATPMDSDQKYIWWARLHRNIANTWQHISDNPEDISHVNARQAFRTAERILEQAVDKSSAAWQQEWIQLQLNQLLPLRGSVDEMTAIIEKAQSVVEQHGTPHQRGYFLLAMAARDNMRDRHVVSEQTVSNCRTALAIFEQTGDQGGQGFACVGLGISLLGAGQLDEAEEQLCVALRYGERGGGATLQARCLTYLPFIYRRRGQVEQVRSIVSRALLRPEARKNTILAGHRAWVAWRDGDLAEAETWGRASIEGQQDNALLWTGLWPLIGVLLTQEKAAEAVDYARMLLDPSQQPLADTVKAPLDAALQAWDAGRREDARVLLRQTLPLAEQMGYL
jgi:DNA-binding SARP family transcriptional activator